MAMRMTRRTACKLVAGTLPTLKLGAAQHEPSPGIEIARGPFEGTRASLGKYEVPEWFRDAKFGIWAHWGPQAVPMDGDWYARGMYEPGNKHYKYHLAHYGHPSEFGYKDIIPLWKAEKWDPDRANSYHL
jgi:alpha-L-fucosidase